MLPLAEVAGLFLRLSLTAFGGPAAHIAMMQDEVVTRRGWVTREEFLDRMGAASLIPGPTSTETVIFLGYKRAGWAGLIVAGACFIVPASVMVAAFAWAYVRFGGVPQVGRFLYGLKPVVMAIIAQALWKLGRTAVKIAVPGRRGDAASIAAAVAGAGALVILAARGVLAAARQWWKSGRRSRAGAGDLVVGGGHRPVRPVRPAPCGPGSPARSRCRGLVLLLREDRLGSLWQRLCSAGVPATGSGHALALALFAALLDAIAAGQITPGPLFTTATFIGYLLEGHAGGDCRHRRDLRARIHILRDQRPDLSWLRRSPVAGAFLDGVNVAALALMASSPSTRALRVGRRAYCWNGAGVSRLSCSAIRANPPGSLWPASGGDLYWLG